MTAGGLANVSGPGGALQIRYDAASAAYVLTSGSSSYSYAVSALQPLAGTPFLFVTDASTGDGVVILDQSTVNLTYVNTGYWLRSQLGSDGLGTFALQAFSYGIDTLPTQMPTSGTAQYNTGMIGSIILNNAAYDARGGFNIAVDFAAGDLSFNGSLETYGQGASPLSVTALAGSGQITSGTSHFAGTLQTGATLSGFALPSLSGNVSGGFYGPNAEEIGGAFRLSGADGLIVAGFSGAQPASP